VTPDQRRTICALRKLNLLPGGAEGARQITVAVVVVALIRAAAMVACSAVFHHHRNW
jgi:hypothetical protein